jgi:hypothetical protein
MTVNRGDIVLVDYPFTAGGAKVRPALVIQAVLAASGAGRGDPPLSAHVG